MKENRTLLSILLCFIFSNSFGFGLGDWQNYTPFGNSMQNYYAMPVSLHMRGAHLEGIKKWYFYKGYIIGILRDDRTYFIANEKTSEIEIYKGELEWQKTIIYKKLKPGWPRWHEGDWTFLDETFVIFYISLFFISIPLTIFLIVALYKSVFKELFDIRKQHT